MKRRLCACLLVLVCLLSGCTDPVGMAVTHKDLTLILPGDFLDLSAESAGEGADFLYGRYTLVFKGLSESKAVLKKMTLEEYTAYVISCNKLTCTPVPSGDGYLFTYEASVGDTVYSYTTATYETADVISTYVYRKGLNDAQYSFSSAVGLFNSIVNFILVFSSNAICKRSTGSSLW